MSSAALSLQAFAAPDMAAPASATLPLQMRSIAPAEWDDAAAGFDEICQEQLSAFAASRWPGVVQEPLLFLRGETVVGGCLVMVQRLPLQLGAIAVAKWAPMLRHAESPDAAETYRGMTIYQRVTAGAAAELKVVTPFVVTEPRFAT